MKRLALAFATGLIMLLNLPTHAQDNKVADDDSAVQATVRNYIEAYYTGDARRMEQTLHPHYLKHKIHGDIPVREQTGPQLVKDVPNGPKSIPAAQRTEQITVLDVAGNIASAKLVTPGWMDYMTLEKVGGEWKILSVVQKTED
jgi:hypothetical protein